MNEHEAEYPRRAQECQRQIPSACLGPAHESVVTRLLCELLFSAQAAIEQADGSEKTSGGFGDRLTDLDVELTETGPVAWRVAGRVVEGPDPDGMRSRDDVGRDQVGKGVRRLLARFKKATRWKPEKQRRNTGDLDVVALHCPPVTTGSAAGAGAQNVIIDRDSRVGIDSEPVEEYALAGEGLGGSSRFAIGPQEIQRDRQRGRVRPNRGSGGGHRHQSA